MTVQMNLTLNELNDIYYALGKALIVYDENQYRRKEMEKLKDDIWKKIEYLDERIREQIEQDEIQRELNFKHVFVRKGDY